jgi:hypothetical protein
MPPAKSLVAYLVSTYDGNGRRLRCPRLSANPRVKARRERWPCLLSGGCNVLSLPFRSPPVADAPCTQLHWWTRNPRPDLMMKSSTWSPTVALAFWWEAFLLTDQPERQLTCHKRSLSAERWLSLASATGAMRSPGGLPPRAPSTRARPEQALNRWPQKMPKNAIFQTSLRRLPS